MEGKKRGDKEERKDENVEASRGVERKREVMAGLGLGGSGLREKKRKRELTRKMSTEQRKTTESSNI